MACKCGGLYAAPSRPDVQSKLPNADATGSGREGLEELRATQPELLRDDGSVSLHDQTESLDADDATCAGGGRHSFGDECLECRDRP